MFHPFLAFLSPYFTISSFLTLSFSLFFAHVNVHAHIHTHLLSQNCSHKHIKHTSSFSINLYYFSSPISKGALKLYQTPTSFHSDQSLQEFRFKSLHLIRLLNMLPLFAPFNQYWGLLVPWRLRNSGGCLHGCESQYWCLIQSWITLEMGFHPFLIGAE